ncbi:uncharacterized protein [Magallana gigas]|uniref:uncharacterized protein isoform X2 n=1 Tax=Magallana gigas TaxID=29159 RepID=UPI00333EFB4B
MNFRSLIVIVSLLVCTESTCVFPGNFWSSGIDSWYDSHKGTLNFTSTTLAGWQVWTIGSFTFTCDSTDQTNYVLRSEEFTYLGLNLEAFLCLRMTQQSSTKFTYDTPTNQLSDAGNERIKIYLKDDKKVVNVISDFCDASSATDLTNHIMVKEGGIEEAKITCPSQLQMNWNYTYDTGSGNVCDDAYLDVCTNTGVLDFDYTKCTQTQAYSTSGELYCLHSTTVGSYTYLYVYNTDTTTDESTTYRFTCYIISSDSNNVFMSQNPQDCPPNGNSTYADSNGALVVLSSLSVCPTEETYSATVAIVLGLLAFLIVIAIVIALVYYCYKRKKRLEAEALKKKEEEDRLERIERERKERIRMEKAALTPTLDLGLPDDSVYDITRLFYEDEEPVTPTKVETDLNERLIDRDNEAFKNDEFMDEYKLRQMLKQARKDRLKPKKRSNYEKIDLSKIDKSKNRWEIHKALAAASRAHARAVADGDTSLGSSPFMSTGSKSSLHTKRVSKKEVPNILQYASNMLVLHLKNSKETKKMKTTKSDRVNGWYPLSSPGQRKDTRSPLSWKDILENSYHMEDYSEYARVPKGNTGFLPSRKHRKVADAELDREIDPENVKHRWHHLK